MKLYINMYVNTGVAKDDMSVDYYYTCEHQLNSLMADTATNTDAHTCIYVYSDGKFLYSIATTLEVLRARGWLVADTEVDCGV